MQLNSIAFIPDGNRRYARFMNIPLLQAYLLGTEKAWKVIDWLNKYKEIKVGTFYTLSLENIQRNALELRVLFKIFEKQLDKVKKAKIFEEQEIKLKFIGKKELLPKKIQEKMLKAEKRTENFKEKQINLAIGYNGQQEIVDAAKKIAEQHKSNSLNLNSLDTQSFKNYLYENFPNPDLIVRTSGAERLSGFLTYQSSYSELAFIDKYWPEITQEDLDNAIQEYYHRTRTFGK